MKTFAICLLMIHSNKTDKFSIFFKRLIKKEEKKNKEKTETTKLLIPGGVEILRINRKEKKREKNDKSERKR